MTNNALAGHTESLSNIKAVVPPRQSADFFMPACRQSYPSLVGVETGHTIPARGNPDAVSLMPRVRPTTRTQVVSLKTSKEVTMTALTIGSSKIRQIDGFYSLNDLHVASGGAEKHQPAFFLRNEQTKALIEEVNSANLQNLNAGNPAIKTERGKYGGTYACKELVIAYAAWISPAFHLKVIRVFLAQVGRTLLAETITKAQQGELATLIAERFPSGKDRPYAWSRFNNHFRLASYKDLPANRFEEACEYIKTMPEPVPALQRPAVNLLDKDYFAKVRDIAIKFADDWVRVGKGEDVQPTLTIPDDVLAGIIAQQLSRQNFRLYVDYAGHLNVDAIPNKSPYEGLAEAIADPGNIGLPDELIEEIGAACVKALAYRAQQRKSIISRTRGAK